MVSDPPAGRTTEIRAPCRDETIPALEALTGIASIARGRPIAGMTGEAPVGGREQVEPGGEVVTRDRAVVVMTTGAEEVDRPTVATTTPAMIPAGAATIGIRAGAEGAVAAVIPDDLEDTTSARCEVRRPLRAIAHQPAGAVVVSGAMASVPAAAPTGRAPATESPPTRQRAWVDARISMLYVPIACASRV
jgi:hypothetical protein